MGKKFQNYAEVKNLLNGSSEGMLNEKEENEETSRCCSCLPRWYLKELKEFFRLALPLVLTYLCQYLFPPISLHFCGKLGTTNQAGAAIAITIINVELFSVGTGLSSACDTLLSQTFGSKNKKKAGVYAQKGLIILGLAVLLCWTLHLNAYSILIATGQDPAVSRVTSEYLVFAMPGLMGYFLYQVVIKYLINQGKVLPGFVIGILGNICNVGFHSLFIIGLGYGTNSSALAQSISYLFMLLCGIIYIKFSKVYEESWDGWSMEAFDEWGDFMKLAVPGMLMLAIEGVSFEISTILAGLLGQVEISAQSISLQIEMIFVMAPIGISVAANIRVGMYLGANNIFGAKKACITAYTLTGMFCLFGATLILLSTIGSLLPRIFSDDPEVIAYSASILPFQAFFHILDGIMATSSGILRGCGRQAICAVVIFIGFYVLGMPVGIPLMFFTNLGVRGYWVGLIIGLSIEAFGFFFLVVRTDWEAEAKLALKRAGVQFSDLEDDEDRPLISSYVDKCLIVRRSIEIGVVFLILAVGIFLHFYFSPTEDICVPYANTVTNPLKLYSPHCNYTSSIP